MAVVSLDGAASGKIASNFGAQACVRCGVEDSRDVWSHEGCGECGGKVDRWVEITVVGVGRRECEIGLCLVYTARNWRKDGSEPFLDIYH